MDVEKIKDNLQSALFGSQIYYFDELKSTNVYAGELAESGAPEGTIVITDYQTEGKGKPGNNWESDKNKNILFSIILYPKLTVNFVQKITLSIAVMTIEAIKHFLLEHDLPMVEFNVKWPNDVLADDKKIGGILLESSVVNKRVNYIIAGLGININQNIDTLSEGIQNKATSLKELIGFKIDREILFTYILFHFEKMYVKFERTAYKDVVLYWKKYCSMFGKKAVFKTPFATEKGIIRDISEEGMLIYESETGIRKKLVSGDIILSG